MLLCLVNALIADAAEPFFFLLLLPRLDFLVLLDFFLTSSSGFIFVLFSVLSSLLGFVSSGCFDIEDVLFCFKFEGVDTEDVLTSEDLDGLGCSESMKLDSNRSTLPPAPPLPPKCDGVS